MELSEKTDEKRKEPPILIQITKITQFISFFKLLKDFSVNKFKRLYEKGKDLIKFFSDTKKIFILSRFTLKDTLSFTEIQQELGVSSSLLSYDLRKMIDLGFIEKTYRGERQNNQFSFYQLTNLGKKVVLQLFSLITK